MPKTRKKKAKTIPRGTGVIVGEFVKVRHVEIPTAELVVFDDKNLDQIEASDLKGKFVKVSPRVPASRRSAFPGQSIAKFVKGVGALGVLISPTFVPDGKKAKAKTKERQSPVKMLDEWIGDQNIDGETADGVRDTVLGFMASEGL